MLTLEQRSILIEKLRSLPVQIERLVAPLTPYQLTTHFLPAEWSVAQNIHHLVDSHINSYIRCKLIATEDSPALKPYDQEQWAALPDAQQADLTASLTLLKGLHARWVTFWENLPEEDWTRTGMHPEHGHLSLAAILRIYAAHGEDHIEQITRTLAAQPSDDQAGKQ